MTEIKNPIETTKRNGISENDKTALVAILNREKKLYDDFPVVLSLCSISTTSLNPHFHQIDFSL
ncbi:MAG: hypothetical protein IPQ19_08930 [Bacteroidetes bacterium]|nr:hypothetical protein [Bacteroidota bacterium]